MDLFDDRIILWGLCSPRSSDLTPPTSSLWNYIDCVFQVEPASIDHLKKLITNLIATINENMLKTVFFNISRCIKLCKEIGGGHIEHLL